MAYSQTLGKVKLLLCPPCLLESRTEQLENGPRPVRGPGADILGGSGAGEGGWFHHAVLQAERSMALAWAVPSLGDGDCLRLTVLHPWASPGDRRTDNPPAVSRSRCYTSSLDVYPKQMTGLLEWQETFGLVLPNPHRLFTDRETEVQRGVLTLIPSPLPPQDHSL